MEIYGASQTHSGSGEKRRWISHANIFACRTSQVFSAVIFNIVIEIRDERKK